MPKSTMSSTRRVMCLGMSSVFSAGSRQGSVGVRWRRPGCACSGTSSGPIQALESQAFGESAHPIKAWWIESDGTVRQILATSRSRHLCGERHNVGTRTRRIRRRLRDRPNPRHSARRHPHGGDEAGGGRPSVKGCRNWATWRAGNVARRPKSLGFQMHCALSNRTGDPCRQPPGSRRAATSPGCHARSAPREPAVTSKTIDPTPLASW
jgi:hypothetical protein